jgi:tripartite ATP-independent transporter DctM subunit
MFGARQFYIIGLLFVVFLAAGYWLSTHNHENWGILLAALTAGTLYSLVASVIERATGFRLISAMAEQVTFVMVPPLALIFLVLGTIFIGLATPTEGGAMGASGALILAMVKRRLTFDLTRQAIESTAKLSSFVVFILVGARVFSLTFYGVDGHRWVEEMLVSMPGGQIGFLVFVNLFVFVLAFFLDFFEIAFIVIPLLGPAAEKLGIDLIWFGVMLGVNMQTSFMHPPFGFALFYLRSVAPKEVKSSDIYWGSVPWVILQLAMTIGVIALPQSVTYFLDAPSNIDPSKVKIEIPAPPSEDSAPPVFK